VAVFLVGASWIVAGALNIWFDLDWVNRVYGRLDEPAVVWGGFAAGVAVILLGLWFAWANRPAWRERRNRYFVVVVPLMALILIEAVRAMLTGYDGAGGGGDAWPERPRFGDVGAGFLVFHATVFSAFVVAAAVWLVRRALRRRSPDSRPAPQ
jgi:hypothetical protein